jgi:hypothetical protein
MQKSGDWNPRVSNELYEELLNRYERMLVFAGQLQEKVRQQKLLVGKNDSLGRENQLLKRLVDVEQSYVCVLEDALEAAGFLKKDSS